MRMYPKVTKRVSLVPSGVTSDVLVRTRSAGASAEVSESNEREARRFSAGSQWQEKNKKSHQTHFLVRQQCVYGNI